MKSFNIFLRCVTFINDKAKTNLYLHLLVYSDTLYISNKSLISMQNHNCVVKAVRQSSEELLLENPKNKIQQEYIRIGQPENILDHVVSESSVLIYFLSQKGGN